MESTHPKCITLRIVQTRSLGSVGLATTWLTPPSDDYLEQADQRDLGMFADHRGRFAHIG
jgi:hypothetical protein